ncbi:MULTISPECIES: hypothetical protein [Nonomuraea]|uniref:DUF3040 domain-containing protein n=1 Tax=Nonomuraea mangrovi TaxID=2316207 RepID=A0ABW4T5C2_9ACTN
MIIVMSMTWKERRSLFDIEDALARDDAEFVERINAINRIEADDASAASSDACWERWLYRHYPTLLLAALVLIVLAVLTAIVD